MASAAPKGYHEQEFWRSQIPNWGTSYRTMGPPQCSNSLSISIPRNPTFWWPLYPIHSIIVHFMRNKYWYRIWPNFFYPIHPNRWWWNRQNLSHQISKNQLESHEILVSNGKIPGHKPDEIHQEPMKSLWEPIKSSKIPYRSHKSELKAIYPMVI